MKVRTPRVNLLHLLLLGERTFDCSYFFLFVWTLAYVSVYCACVCFDFAQDFAAATGNAAKKLWGAHGAADSEGEKLDINMCATHEGLL